MHSTLKLKDSDPHDDFSIAPDVVPSAWADKVLADIKRDAAGPVLNQPPAISIGAAAAPAVDTTFRATATASTGESDAPAEPPPTNRWVKSAVMLVFAITSAAAAAAWQNHGDAAKQMLSNWMPAFAATSSPPTENAALPGQADAPAAQVSDAEQTGTPSAAAPAQPPTTATAAPSPDTAQLETVTRELAAMAREVEQLKASIAELKASQQAMTRDGAKAAEARAAEIKPAAPNPRPRPATTPPVRAAAAPPPPRSMPAYPPAQTYPPAQAYPAQVAAPARPAQAYPPASMQSVPPPPQDTARADDDGPIVRPPMPLR
jgi:hypothetical protein